MELIPESTNTTHFSALSLAVGKIHHHIFNSGEVYNSGTLIFLHICLT